MNLSEANEDTDDLLTLYTYDAFDRLVKIEQGADVIENTYTADGKKLSRTTNGVLTYYVYDGNVVIEEQDSNNDESARNVYGRNLVTRETVDGLVVYAYNGHSDVVAICNLDGDTLVIYDYDEFGNVISETVIDETYTNFDNPYRYAGYEYIEEVKLYDLNARYYNPEIARFLSQDPYYNLGNRVIGIYEINVPNAWSIIQANNIYVYCGNCPVIFFDYFGHAFNELDEAFYKELLANGAREEAEEFKNGIDSATKEFENAKTYAEKNRAHDKAIAYRLKYDPNARVNDTYDYTHGGKYEVKPAEVIFDESNIDYYFGGYKSNRKIEIYFTDDEVARKYSEEVSVDKSLADYQLTINKEATILSMYNYPVVATATGYMLNYLVGDDITGNGKIFCRAGDTLIIEYTTNQIPSPYYPLGFYIYSCMTYSVIAPDGTVFDSDTKSLAMG